LRFSLENMLEEMPEDGYPLFIVMHGGGQTAPQINDRSWRGIQSRYKVKGKYLCPRAPRDTWDHWHNEYVHPFFHKLIEGMILHEQVDPNKIYIMGYSSGGYGTFQLAPILADRWAAAAVAAAGPTSAHAENLRNLPFNLQVGTQDTAHGRIEVATRFAVELAELHAADPAGYIYEWIPHEGRGHGIDDRSSVDWMIQFTRNPTPDKVVWVQGYDTAWRASNPSRKRFYWLATRPDYQRVEGRTDSVTAQIKGQAIHLSVEGFETLRVRLNDAMLDLDQPVTIIVNGEKRFEDKPPRTLATMLETFEEYHDPNLIFPAEVEVAVNAGE
jgi:predicted esterase